MISVKAPVSKSEFQRALIGEFLNVGSCSLLPADGVDLAESDDIVDCRKAIRAAEDGAEPYVGDSATALRILLPVLRAKGFRQRINMSKQLADRPSIPLFERLAEGEFLKSGEYKLSGGISSQFISGLLFSLPICSGDSVLEVEELKSKPYIDMTLDTLSDFGIGIDVKCSENGKWIFRIPGNQEFCRSEALEIYGDWSGAAYIMAKALAEQCEVKITGLDRESRQGDKAIVEVIECFGSSISWSEDGLILKPGKVKGIRYDASDTPDLVPAIAAAAAFGDCDTVITGTERLRFKESDRIEAILCNLNADYEAGTLTIHPADSCSDSQLVSRDSLHPHKTPKASGSHPQPPAYRDFDDHRIAMMCDIVSRGKSPESTSIRKSYPGYYQAARTLQAAKA